MIKLSDKCYIFHPRELKIARFSHLALSINFGLFDKFTIGTDVNWSNHYLEIATK